MSLMIHNGEFNVKFALKLLNQKRSKFVIQLKCII